MPRDRGACPRGSRTCPPGERPSVRPLRGGDADWDCPPGRRSPALRVTPGPRAHHLGPVGQGCQEVGRPPAAARSPLVRGLGGEAAAHGCHGSRGQRCGEGVRLSQRREEPGEPRCGQGCAGARVASTETSPGATASPRPQAGRAAPATFAQDVGGGGGRALGSAL